MTGSEAKKTFVAVGSLIGAIQQERARVKADFAQTFANFATSANRNEFKRLFAGKKQKKKS